MQRTHKAKGARNGGRGSGNGSPPQVPRSRPSPGERGGIPKPRASVTSLDGNSGGAGPLESVRSPFRVPQELAVVRTEPSSLPETPRESHGLFELVPTVARRALELGLSAREPSFHVFVAADPQVMIEDDVVRYATRFAAARPTPDDIVYVHDFDHPEAPRPLVLPAGVGPRLVAAMEGLIERLQEEIPRVVERDEFKRAQSSLAT